MKETIPLNTSSLILPCSHRCIRLGEKLFPKPHCGIEDSQNLSARSSISMGYRTRVTPKGPDRGVDIFASPDGLGFQEPRIKVEVKHRPRTTMGSQDLRSFLGGLREGDRGLYVSTGGFTKEVGYEAERSKIPVTLLDLDDLVTYIVTHYESLALPGHVDKRR